jgi:glutathione peroxidase
MRFAAFAPFLCLGAVAAAVPADAACDGLLDFRMSTLQGKPANLCDFRGKVVLVVNTASYCGYTPQYKGLEALYEDYRAKGLVVVGFPSNDFGAQEPGSNQEVADFCERTYKVTFPMMEKVSVAEGHPHPFYARLARETGAPPKWNFHKYLIDRDGKTVRSFPSAVEPDAPELLKTVEQMLAQKPS